MAQVLEPRIDKSTITLFQDLYFVKKRTCVKSAVEEVSCTICDKGLDEDVSVTAKKIGKKTSFFCQYHLSESF